MARAAEQRAAAAAAEQAPEAEVKQVEMTLPIYSVSAAIYAESVRDGYNNEVHTDVQVEGSDVIALLNEALQGLAEQAVGDGLVTGASISVSLAVRPKEIIEAVEVGSDLPIADHVHLDSYNGRVTGAPLDRFTHQPLLQR